LAISRRLFDGKPSCLWVIGATALVTVTLNPALGLVLDAVMGRLPDHGRWGGCPSE
jgi:hypothetical protein